MKAVWIVVLISLTGSGAFAQSRTLYYNHEWQIAPKDNSSHYRICNIISGVIKHYFVGEVKDYTVDGKLVMSGSYSQLGLKDGTFTFYFPSGKVQAQGKFNTGFRVGVWKYFFENGQLEREVKFPIPEKFSPPKTDFTPASVYDSLGNIIIENGTGIWHYEYEWPGVDGLFVVEGKFEKGKKEGEWTCTLNGDVLYKEIYKSDKFKEGFVINGGQQEKLTEPIDNKFILPYKFEVTESFVYQKGTTIDMYPFLKFLSEKEGPSEIQSRNSLDTIPDDEKVFFAVEQQAEFPGGMGNMMKFIRKNLKYPSNARRMGIEGNVYVKFIIEKDGTISNAQIQRGINSDLDQEAIRIVRLFPKWSPGKQNDKPVKSQFIIPIPFKLDF